MDEHQSDDPKDKKAVVKTSIKKVKEKVEPGFKFSLLFSAIIQTSMLVIGCINVHKCPVEKHIPLFLIVVGAIGLVSKCITYIRERISSRLKVVYIESALYSVEAIFFFLGSYWVYKEFQPNYNPNSGPLYCNKTAYLFAFSYLTIVYTIFIAILCGLCCFVCCALFLVAVESANSDPESPNTKNAGTSST